MNVLSVVLGSDPAGISVGIATAFQTERDWSVRSLVSKQNYIEYPVDLDWNFPNLIAYWEAADVVHLHHGFVTADRVIRGFAGRRLQRKPYVVQYHGTGFREHWRAHLTELRDRRAVGLTSTLDLWLLGPDLLEWLPSPVNARYLGSKGKSVMTRTPERVLIVHAPTNREVKSTEDFLAAVRRLQDEGYPVDLDLIEHRPWHECLERKAKADIYFDQIILGYGCNALEAWAMGIPVVAGAADETLDEMERRFGHLPFYHATAETIYDALKELVESPELRRRYGKIGQDYVRKYHDYPVVVEQLKRIYRRAVGETEEQAA